MARAIVHLDRNRSQLAGMIGHAVAFARNNTQEIWLERRLSWILPGRSSNPDQPAFLHGSPLPGSR
jgi:hypothetical protein